MLTVRRPSAAAVADFLSGQRAIPLSYPHEGMTRGNALAGFNVDRLRRRLGNGAGVFERAVKNIRGRVELAAQDVILIHRLTKNSIDRKEYILLTEEFYRLVSGKFEGPIESRVENAEGMGRVPVKVSFPCAESDASPMIPGRRVKFWENWKSFLYSSLRFSLGYAIPRYLRIKARKKFNHLPEAPLRGSDFFRALFQSFKNSPSTTEPEKS
jgi:hypothetical protein